MSRHLVLACLSSLFVVACAGAPPGGRVSEERPPNLLLIVADDQGWADLSCAGLAPDVTTPALDALAARGVRYTRAYATSPICNASRMGLMTGVYQQRLGTYWYGGEGLHDARFPTLAELLRAAGYATGYVGKFHYGRRAVHVPGERSFPLEHGFDSLYGFSDGRKHYLVHEAAAEARFQASMKAHQRRGQSLRQDPFWVDGEEVDQRGFSTELLGAAARAFLREHASERAGQPFFLALSFNAVHNFTHQLPPEYLRANGLAGLHDWDPAEEDYYEWYAAGRYPNNPEGRALYLGQLHYLDLEVGRVMDELDALGLREDTLVVYLGDNGGSTPIYANNGPLRGSKYTLYEGGIRVPLIVSWPGRWPEGVVREEVVSALDVLPTLCGAAGAALPARLDGMDLGPLLAGDPAARGHELLVWDTGHQSAVRAGRWKLETTETAEFARHEMVEVELGTFLYDLAADPGEQHDLAAREPEVVERLQAIRSAWRARWAADAAAGRAR